MVDEKKRVNDDDAVNDNVVLIKNLTKASGKKTSIQFCQTNHCHYVLVDIPPPSLRLFYPPG